MDGWLWRPRISQLYSLQWSYVGKCRPSPDGPGASTRLRTAARVILCAPPVWTEPDLRDSCSDSDRPGASGCPFHDLFDLAHPERCSSVGGRGRDTTVFYR